MIIIANPKYGGNPSWPVNNITGSIIPKIRFTIPAIALYKLMLARCLAVTANSFGKEK